MNAFLKNQEIDTTINVQYGVVLEEVASSLTKGAGWDRHEGFGSYRSHDPKR